MSAPAPTSADRTNLSVVSAQVEPWTGGLRRGRHSIMAELARRHDIWWLTYPHGLRDVLQNWPAGPARWFTWRQVHHERLHELTPPLLLPASRFTLIDGLTRRVRHASLRRLLSRHRAAPRVLYVWHPVMAGLVGNLGEDLLVYHKFDHFAHNLGVGPELLADEAELIQRADLVIVVSEALRQLHAHERADIHVVPNGVNWEEFEYPAQLPEPLLARLESLPRPRLCYTGPLSDKVDLATLDALAERHPEWAVVLVGPAGSLKPECRSLLGRLVARPNVHHLPPEPGHLIPGILVEMDVCLLANHLTEYTHHTSPLKLYDYLASGKPVVSSDLAAVRSFAPAVRIARTLGEWESEVEAALREDSPEDQAGRLMLARENSWRARVSRIEELMAGALRAKGSRGPRGPAG